jgi:hypothetical protein
VACVLSSALLQTERPARSQGKGEGEPADPHADLLARADQIANKVSQLRGLPIQSPIRRGVMNKQQITERLLKRLKEEYKEDQIRGEELALKRLGLLPVEADYLQLIIKLLTDQIAGFYDPVEKQLYIADWNLIGGDFIMAHEIDHALQDQRFKLQEFLSRAKNDNDALLARQALVEGDGMALGLEFTLDAVGQQVPWGQEGFAQSFRGGFDMGRATIAKDVPLILRELLLFPYTGGLEFIAYYRKHHPWSRIDEIFAKPPLSTEQIMHPERYEADDAPVQIVAGKLPELRDYRLAYENVLGELGLQLLLRQHGVSEIKAQVAALGWGGDRLVLYSPPGYVTGIGGLFGVLYTAWDDDPDAVEFFSALEEAMSSLTGGKQTVKRVGYIEYRTSRGEVAVLEMKKRDVVLMIGAPPARAEELRAGVWAKWKIRLGN